MKGDRVLVLVDTGGAVREFVVEADCAGRSVEVKQTRAMVEVSVLGRTGTTIKTDRFMASRVVALVRVQGRGWAESPWAGLDRPMP